ncbi:MAG: hypothetical protein KDD69_19040 [Bdellovibrionales bacterium]|nr:hypothetical protein [Bdellovibrionales bacterium]
MEWASQLPRQRILAKRAGRIRLAELRASVGVLELRRATVLQHEHRMSQCKRAAEELRKKCDTAAQRFAPSMPSDQLVHWYQYAEGCERTASLCDTAFQEAAGRGEALRQALGDAEHEADERFRSYTRQIERKCELDRAASAVARAREDQLVTELAPLTTERCAWIL